MQQQPSPVTLFLPSPFLYVAPNRKPAPAHRCRSKTPARLGSMCRAESPSDGLRLLHGKEDWVRLVLSLGSSWKKRIEVRRCPWRATVLLDESPWSRA
jgi:hypothetical protein